MSNPLTIESYMFIIPFIIIYSLSVSVYAVKNRRNANLFKLITLLSLGIYVSGVLDLTLFPIVPFNNLAPWHSAINIIPILTIDFWTFGLNVIMLVPLGVYLYLIQSSEYSLKSVALYSFACSALIELTQMIIRMTLMSGRSVDVNDLIANTLGGIIGYWVICKLTEKQWIEDLIQPFMLKVKM